jgi:hypothetical protein
MIEVADVFRRFAADYLAAHGASLPPSHRRAIEDILRPGVALRGVQQRGVLLPPLQQSQLPQVPYRADARVARMSSGGDATGALLPHHRHRPG